MALPVVLALFCVIQIDASSSEVIHIYANKSLLRTPQIGYVHFIYHAQSKLDVENAVQVYAQYPKQCALGCATNMTCKSFNFGKQPIFFLQGNAQYLCELLPTDKYSLSSAFQATNPDYDHYSIKSECFNSPCLHNFPCHANYIDDTYNCLCPRPPYEGKDCKDADECTTNQHDCSSHAICTNLIGSYKCKCKFGYLGDGKTCEMATTLQESDILRGYGNVSYFTALQGFMGQVQEDINSFPWIRCWSGTRDGWDVKNIFHPQCDGKGPTVTLVRKKQYIWGGYTDVPWGTADPAVFQLSMTSFLFTLYNIEGFKPQTLLLIETGNAVNHYTVHGPTFGAGYDLLIESDAWCKHKPRSYNMPVGCSTASWICLYYASESAERYKVDDVEVFYKSTA